MNYAEWHRTYQPVKNTIYTDASFDGHMYETYGADLEFVSKQTNTNVWTIVDGDDNALYLSAGYHLVNRVGYMITRIPWESKDIEIEIEAPRFFSDVLDDYIDPSDNQLFLSFIKQRGFTPNHDQEILATLKGYKSGKIDLFHLFSVFDENYTGWKNDWFLYVSER